MHGGTEDENERYGNFLKYCESRREEGKRIQDEDEERKLLAKEKEDHWRLLRLSIQYLKENEPKWRSRKIKECDRIREEEKADRLAIAKMKKKRYGVKGLSKEENGRMKQRTEERLEIARAKENLWKLHRGNGRGDRERCQAWKQVQECIFTLEEREKSSSRSQQPATRTRRMLGVV